MRSKTAVASALIFFGLFGWLLVTELGRIPILEDKLRGQFWIHSALLPLPGLLLGLAFVLLWRIAPPDADGVVLDRATRRFVLACAVAGLVVLLVAGAAADLVPPARAALLAILGVISLMLAFALIEMMARDGFTFESHWGGLGGGMSGWRLSRSVILAVLLLIVTGGTVGVAVMPLSGTSVEPKPGAGSADSQADAAKPSAKPTAAGATSAAP